MLSRERRQRLLQEYSVVEGYSLGGDLGAVCAYYIPPNRRHYEKAGEWTNYECPGCPSTGFMAHYERGTARCDEVDCDLYQPRDASGMIAYFEGLDPRTDTRAINRKRREILEVVSQEREEKAQEEERERRERLQRQREHERQQAESQRQAEPPEQPQQPVEQQVSSTQSQQEAQDLQAQGEELFGSREEFQEAVEEKRRQRQEEAEAEQKKQDRLSREKVNEEHYLLQKRAVRAGVRITAGELFWAAVVCAVVAVAFSYGVGYLDDFSHYARGYYAIGTEEARVAAEEGWFMGSVRATVDFVVPDVVADWRQWIGFSLGAVAGLALWVKVSGKRRQEAAFADHEGLNVTKYDRKVRNYQ